MPIVCIGIPAIGVLAAVALPAYQNYAKPKAPAEPKPWQQQYQEEKETSRSSEERWWENDKLAEPAPNLVPFYGKTDEELARERMKKSALDRGIPTEKKPPPQLDLSEFTAENQRLLKDKEVLRSQGIGGNQEIGDVVAWGEAMLSARSITGKNLRDAHNLAVMWQGQLIIKSAFSPARNLFLGYRTILNNLDETHQLCRPDVSRDGGVVFQADGTFVVFRECRPL